MSMINDFKAFVARGNVLDLAIGVIMGAAFGKVVSTFTEGIIMPVVGLIFGGNDFKHKFWDIGGNIPAGLTGKPLEDAVEAAIKSGKPLIMYGQLFSDILNFLIVGFIMFMIAKAAMGYFTRLAAETPPPPPTPEETLLSEIRDLLAKK
jgi:large conductance mechanosensitive channel